MEEESEMDGVSKPHGGEMLAEISNGLVALHMRYYGKGPDEAKTYSIDDTIVSVLRGGFTTVERTLIDDGRPATVREMREHFQGAMRDEFVSVVQGATGREVSAYMNQIHIDPDLAVEIFMLAPESEE
jgi:uncharacterized protein YbcI